jgi:hypothetical protein
MSHPDPGTVPDYESWFRRSAGEILRQAYFCTRDQEGYAKPWVLQANEPLSGMYRELATRRAR